MTPMRQKKISIAGVRKTCVHVHKKYTTRLTIFTLSFIRSVTQDRWKNLFVKDKTRQLFKQLQSLERN